MQELKIAVLIVLLFVMIYLIKNVESYRSCCLNGCGDNCTSEPMLISRDFLTINPFMNPHSGKWCPEENQLKSGSIPDHELVV